MTTPTEAQEKAYVDGHGERCLFCGSDWIEGTEVTIESGKAYQEVQCGKCGKYWTDVYTLTGVCDPR